MGQDVPVVDGDAAIVCDVGRRGVRVALTDAAGQLRPDTIRSYDASVTTTISGTLTTFKREAGLSTLPRHCAIAVAGVARGDTIAVTNSRWFISRSGLRSMLQQPPLILNDFAAQAWAIGCAPHATFEALGSGSVRAPERAGTYVVLGMTTGLGVAVLVRDEAGRTSVLSTEAGHGCPVPLDGEAEALLGALFPNRHQLTAEYLLSGPGLFTLYRALATREVGSAALATAEDVTRHATHDRHAARACELVARAFWAFAGNAVMNYGAWDGVLVTGRLAHAIRPMLRQPAALDQFVRPGSYVRLLRETPRALFSVEHGELAGAACALREVRAADGLRHRPAALAA